MGRLPVTDKVEASTHFSGKPTYQAQSRVKLHLLLLVGVGYLYALQAGDNVNQVWELC
jgi:hypothetical protein